MSPTVRVVLPSLLVLAVAGAGSVQVLVPPSLERMPQASTNGRDPLFGQGCRYVAVDTPTPVQPHVTVCRPW